MDSLVSPYDAHNEDDFFLEWYDKLDHFPAKPTLKLSEVGKIPKRISRIFKEQKLPVCTFCIFRQARQSHGELNVVNEPGGGILTD